MNEMAQFSKTRRRLLIGGVVAIAVAGSASWYRYGSARGAWVEHVVRSNLPGIALDPGSLAHFVRDALASDLLRSLPRQLSVHIDSIAPWLTARVPKIRDGLEVLERQVLTEFLMGSNFFRVADPKRETIQYYGRVTACANPFVRR